MTERKTLKELLELSHTDQHTYLTTLLDKDAERRLAQAIVRAESNGLMQQMIDNLNSNAEH